MPPHAELAAMAALAIALIVLAGWIGLRALKRNPEKRERRRRLYVHHHGRLGDAVITEVTDAVIYYTYSVHGVQYSASQDIAALRDKLPQDLGRLVGAANLKYSAKNPANSILVCEEWSGLRITAAA
ncbi:MAG TPA: hypothetical protein VH639_25365 [Bryobacteraceae bacterium]|jgi:hypothetical protein